MSDPLRRFEHSHASLTKLASEIGEIVGAKPGARPASRTNPKLVGLLERTRDELLSHFAYEEEGLFPFVRLNVPAKADAVERLADAHDAIAGGIVRLVHLVQSGRIMRGMDRPALLSHYERFVAAYAEHSQAEARLLDELAQTLNVQQRAELEELLRGL